MVDKKPAPSQSGKPDPKGHSKTEMDKGGKAPAKPAAPVKKGSGKYC